MENLHFDKLSDRDALPTAPDCSGNPFLPFFQGKKDWNVKRVRTCEIAGTLTAPKKKKVIKVLS